MFPGQSRLLCIIKSAMEHLEEKKKKFLMLIVEVGIAGIRDSLKAVCRRCTTRNIQKLTEELTETIRIFSFSTT